MKPNLLMIDSVGPPEWVAVPAMRSVKMADPPESPALPEIPMPPYPVNPSWPANPPGQPVEVPVPPMTPELPTAFTLLSPGGSFDLDFHRPAQLLFRHDAGVDAPGAMVQRGVAQVDIAVVVAAVICHSTIGSAP